MLKRRADLPEVGAVYRFPSGRFYVVLMVDGHDVTLHQVDAESTDMLKNGETCMTVAALAKGVLAWHAKEWRRKVADCKEIQA